MNTKFADSLSISINFQERLKCYIKDPSGGALSFGRADISLFEWWNITKGKNITNCGSNINPAVEPVYELVIDSFRVATKKPISFLSSDISLWKSAPTRKYAGCTKG